MKKVTPCELDCFHMQQRAAVELYGSILWNFFIGGLDFDEILITLGLLRLGLKCSYVGRAT